LKNKINILIVEDENIIVMNLQRLLKSLGYHTAAVVNSGAEALKKVEELKPDLILMDIVLKDDMDGIEAADRIRSQFDIPVVFLTAYIDDEKINKVIRTEPYGYIIKPYQDGELRIAVEMALNKHQVNRALKESEEKYKDLVEKSGIAILIDDEEGGFKYFNKKFAEMFGFSMKEMKNRQISSIVHPDDGEWVMKLHTDRILGKRRRSKYEFRGIRKDGSTIYLEVNTSLIKENGKIIGTRYYMTDITKRKKMEVSIAESEERYKGLFENSTDFIYTLDLEGSFTNVNKAAERLTGYKKDELIGMNLRDYTSRDTQKRLIQAFNKVFKTGESLQDLQLDVTIKDGTKKYFDTSAGRIIKGNEVIGFQGSSRDITERKRVVEELRESEELHRTLIDTLPDAVAMFDLQGQFIYASSLVPELFGVESVEDLIGTNGLRFIAPEEKDTALKNLAAALEKGIQKGVEYTVVRGDGIRFSAELNVSPLRDSDGKAKSFIIVIRDITKRKRAEEMLKKSEEKYRMIFEKAPVGITHFDMNGVITSCNTYLAKILGARVEKIIGFDMVSGVKDIQSKAAIQEVLSGRVGYFEGKYTSITGGKSTIIKNIYSPVFSEDGSQVGGI